MKEIIINGHHLNKPYVMATAYVCLQKKSDQEIIKADYLNLEAFVRIPLITFADECLATAKANKEILETLDITEAELWESARERMKDRFIVKSMTEMLGLPAFMDDGLLKVGTTKEKMHGASILMYPEVFDRITTEDLYILPSSIHEVIIVKANGDFSPADLFSLVGEVNATEVEPNEVLGQAVYKYNKATNTITVEK